MNKGENKSNKLLWRVLCVIGIALVTGMGVLIYASSGKYNIEKEYSTSFSDGWRVSYHGKTDENVNLDDYVIKPAIKKGDSVVLSKIIPQNINVVNPLLIIETHNSAISADVDGEQIYSYGWDRYSQNKMVGSGRHYIPINESYKGKEITITIMNSEKLDLASINPIILTRTDKAQVMILQKYRIPWIFGNFLQIFGLALMMFGFVTGIKQPAFLKMVWLGILSLCAGMWTICYYGLTDMYNIPIYQSSFMEYFLFTVGAIPVLIYIRSYVKDNKKMYTVYKIILSLQLLISGTILLQHMFNINHMPSNRGFIYVMMVVIFMYTVIYAAAYSKKGSKSGRIINIGLIFAIGSMILDLLKYFVYEKLGMHNILSINGMTAIGATILVFFILISFAMDISEQLKLKARQEALYNMAYTDSLTQIYNRRYCEEKLDKLSESNTGYGIFNFDLNFLKRINDTYGHSYGDQLIKGFAGILMKTFGDIATVGRMGGDEYIVIINDIEKFNYDEYIGLLNKNIIEENSKSDKVIYSAAYGYADSDEVGNGAEKVDARQVYTLADNRMYENKITVKGHER